MRLLIVGTLAGHISAAGQIAIGRGAKVSHVETVDAGLTALRNGRGADLVMIDVRLSAPRLLEAMKAERINTPVVACGIDPDPEAAEAAIRAGAKEYIPLPPDAELIAAVLAAVRGPKRRHSRRPGDGRHPQTGRSNRPLGRQRAGHRRKRHRQRSAGPLPAQ